MAYNTQAAKPFSIQDPDKVAEIFGYDTQRIGQAMQLGTVNPTSGLLAVMKIQKIRAAEPGKQFPQATVAQQVMGGASPAQPAAPAPAPVPLSPGGLGATPQAAPPMTPPMPQMPQGPGMAEGGDVNSYRLTSRPEYERFRAEDVPAPKFEDLLRQFTGGGIQHKVGKGTARARYSPLDKRADYGIDMPLSDRTGVFAGASGNRGVVPTDFRVGIRHSFADGGYVGPYASAGSANVGPQPQMIPGNQMAAPYTQGGGLSDVPIPDTMFDEPSNGGFGDGYGGGGLVAFAGGSPGTLEEDFDAEFADRTPKGDVYYGYSASDPLANAAVIEKLFGKPQTKYTDEYEQQLLAERSPEALKKAKNQDLGLALMAMGSRMASTPGGLLQSAAAALGAGAPILAQSAKERKAAERDLRKGLLDIEAGRNSAAAQRAAQLLQAQQMGISAAEAQKAREAQINLEGVRHQGDLELERLRQSGENYRAGLRRTAGSGGGGGGSSSKPLSPTAAEKVMGRAEKQMAANLALMEKADKSGDLDTVDRARANYAAALNTYNRAAGDIRLPPIQGARARIPNWIQRASQSVRQRPNPGGPQVQNGRIVSVQDIPPAR